MLYLLEKNVYKISIFYLRQIQAYFYQCRNLVATLPTNLYVASITEPVPEAPGVPKQVSHQSTAVVQCGLTSVFE